MSRYNSHICYAEATKANAENVKFQDRLEVLGYEFSYKVKHDFRRYLFLGVKPARAVSLETVLKEEIQHDGYEKHKIIKYHAENGEKILHLYLKYRTVSDVLAVQRKYREERTDYHAEVVADILKGWYSYENMSERPVETFGVLDIVGQAEFNKPLSIENAHKVLNQFGGFRITNVAEDQVKVGFHSMAEGIASCIALGEWFVKLDAQDHKFYYRVLLDQSDHFARLVNRCNNNSNATDAFNLDYFVPFDAASKNAPQPLPLQSKTKSDSAVPLPATYKYTKHRRDYLPFSYRGNKKGFHNAGQNSARTFRPKLNYEYRNMPASYCTGTYVNPYNFPFSHPSVQYYPHSNVTNVQTSYLQ